MDVGLEVLQPLFVGDAETLLFVDDDEAELLEIDALGEQRVGADDDIDLALDQQFPGSFRLARGNQSG